MPQGTPIYAAGNGTVSFTAVDNRNCNPDTYPGGINGCVNAGMQGTRVHIAHPDGSTSRYYHLSGIAGGIGTGTAVVASQLIGYSGNSGISTGPHLHYDERNAQNVAVNPGNWTACHGSAPITYDNLQARKGQSIRNDGYSCSTPLPLRGSFDEATSPAPGQLRVRGWAFDEDAKTSAINIHVYVGGPAGDAAAQGFDIGPANGSRADVGAAFPGVGNYHGYDRTLDVAKFGNQPVYVYAINAPSTPGNNMLIASRTVNIPQPNPFGSLDSADSPKPGWIRVRGWTADPNSPATSLAVHVYGGPKILSITTADQSRPDVGAAVPGYGNLHGYDATFAAPPGTYNVCTYGINIGVGNNNSQLGCRSVTVVADVTPPQTTITSEPPPTGTTTGISFAFAADESGSTFACQWDGAAWTPCTSPQTRTLPIGAHTFGVRATDAAGNADATPATGLFTITAPTPAVVAPPVVATPPATASQMSVLARAIRHQSKLHVDLSPDSGDHNYKFKVQRRVGGTWRTIKKTTTRGSADQRQLDLRRGKYRVVVPAQFQLEKCVSRIVKLRR